MLALRGGGPAIPARALFLGAEPHSEIGAGVMGWQPFKPSADAWEQAGFQRVDEPAGRWPMVLLLPGKSRDETLAWFAKAYDLLEPEGVLVAAMPNTAGAARFEKALAEAAGGITSIQKHKCRAFQVKKSNGWNETLLNEWRELGKRRVIPGTAFKTMAGIFSADHIDPGSQLLADHLPASIRGNVADLGAGWGFLTDAVLKRCPAVERVDLFEADSRALACAEENLSHHQRGLGHRASDSSPCLTGDERELGFHWHDVTKGLPGTYDAIVMNPPFHTGQTTDVDLGRSFLKAAASLNRGGKLFLVANRQLPYEAGLAALGLRSRNVAENSVYKILFAERR